ncbi:hypothetical protein NKG94_28665 [Micromonospora sp. M12]
MAGRLPAGRSGRHLIYTIWQNSNTRTPTTPARTWCSVVPRPPPPVEGRHAEGRPPKGAPRTAASAPAASGSAVAAADPACRWRR